MDLVLMLVIARRPAGGGLRRRRRSAALLRASPGNDKMQEIAAAIQEGAQAYLRRQYTTIAIVGVVILLVDRLPDRLDGGARLPDRRGALRRGGLRRHADLGRANVRTAQAASESLAKGLSLAFRSGAVTGMLVAGFALLGVAGYYAVLTGAAAAWSPPAAR